MQITVIGGGSTYTPELVDGLIKKAQKLGIKKVVLYDIAPERLEIVGELGKRMVKAAGSPFVLELSVDQKKALTGADFVLNQIRVGGQEGRDADTDFCLENDLIGQETTGAAGFAKALRTIPVVLELCTKIKQYAPQARLINFTNPAGIITESVLKYGQINCIGLCNIPINMRMELADIFSVSPADVYLDYVGLNHLSWVRKVFVKGEDVTESALEEFDFTPANNPQETGRGRFQRALGMITNSYLDYFYREREMLQKLKAKEQTRAREVLKIENELLEKYKQQDLDSKPEELEKRGGAYYSTIAVALLEDIILNSGNIKILNVRNNGALPDLPREAVVEVPAVVDARGAQALTGGKLEPEIRGLIQQVKAYEELTVEAAVSKSYDKALLALANNPLLDSVAIAEKVLDFFNERYALQLS